MKQLKQILRIADDAPDGFTVKLPNLETVTRGIVVGYAETQNCFGEEGLIRVLEHAMRHEMTIGGWLDEDTGLYYFDSVKVFTDRDEAIRFGRENGQLAIFDLDNLEVIKL